MEAAGAWRMTALLSGGQGLSSWGSVGRKESSFQAEHPRRGGSAWRKSPSLQVQVESLHWAELKQPSSQVHGRAGMAGRKEPSFQVESVRSG